jgi:aspartate/methionine/tyrosine aminotransferase
MLSSERLGALARWCSDNDVRLISDELYHGISYGSTAATAWQYNRDAIVVNSFSKYFAMTGWRLGWLLIPPSLADAVDRLAGNYTICPPTLSQLAALAAFDCYPELDAHVARYAANRSLLLKELPNIGLSRLAPADGAFYIYADVSDHTDDSLGWVRRALRDTGVALAPGIDFDTRSGARFARLSFAGESREIEQAVEVLARYLH